jgi:plasmid stabilization system protein ParE
VKRLRLVISDEAISDLIDLWTYIAEDSPERADQFVDQIHEKCQTHRDPDDGPSAARASPRDEELPDRALPHLLPNRRGNVAGGSGAQRVS